MVNDPKLINKIIQQIKSLTYEEITEVIRKVDMEEDIKELTRLYDIAEVVLPQHSTDKITYRISEKQRISINNVLNRLKEDEAVIDKICTDIGLDYGYDKDDVITRYREKVKYERNKV